MKNKYSLVVFAALVMLCLAVSKPVEAQYYGGGEKKEISIDKKIRPQESEKAYDNIDVNQKVFKEGDMLDFNIVIENVGNKTLENIIVTDKLPSNLSLMFYPGTYNKSTRTIEWKIDKLEPGQKTKPYIIRARIDGTVDLDTATQTNVKKTNEAEAKSGDVSDKDNASYFIKLEKKNVPVTGPEDMIVKTIIMISLAGSGIAIRKYVRGY